MNQEALLKLSLIVSISGILLLLLLSMTIQPKEITSNKELKVNDYVKTTARILSIKTLDDFSIIKLDNNITLTCNCKFEKNSTITATGRVIEYENSLEVQGEKIENAD